MEKKTITAKTLLTQLTGKAQLLRKFNLSGTPLPQNQIQSVFFCFGCWVATGLFPAAELSGRNKRSRTGKSPNR